MITAKQLTENSWMLKDVKLDKSIGMVRKSDLGRYVIFGIKTSFDSLEEVAAHFGGELVELDDEEVQEILEPKFINGYPVKHREAFETESKEIKGVIVETYKNKEKSRKVFAAGWYGMKFKNGLVNCFCPKFSTLENSDFIGPYKNEIDLEFEVKKYNNQLDIL